MPEARKKGGESMWKPTLRLQSIEIAETPYGLGVFAKRRFKGGKVVGEVRGKYIDDPDYGSHYCIDLGIGVSMEPIAPFRFLNHSCDPNCILMLPPDGDPGYARKRPKIKLETLREIEVGEQMTIDYAWPADAAIPCGCQSKHCRGWIVDVAQLAQVRRVGLEPLYPKFDSSAAQAVQALGQVYPVGDGAVSQLAPPPEESRSTLKGVS